MGETNAVSPWPDELNVRQRMIIEAGDRILACHRRLFEKDEPRFFAGEVLESNDSVIKARGFSFSRDLSTGHIVVKNEQHTKIISVISGTYLLYALPDDVAIEHLRFVQDKGKLVLADQAGFRMDLTEHGQSRRI